MIGVQTGLSTARCQTPFLFERRQRQVFTEAVQARQKNAAKRWSIKYTKNDARQGTKPVSMLGGKHDFHIVKPHGMICRWTTRIRAIHRSAINRKYYTVLYNFI
jgi:hypothetical protein